MKKGLLIVLWMLFFCTVVYAETDYTKRIYLSENYSLRNETDSQLFFFMSDGIFGQDHSGDVYLLFGKMDFRGSMTGNFYAFFSEVTFREKSVYEGMIKTVGARVIVQNDAETMLIKPAITLLNFLVKDEMNGADRVYTDTIPQLVILFTYIAVNLFICLTLYSVKKSFFEQGSMIVKNENIKVVRNGIYVYFIFLSLIVIFLISVVGFLISLGLFAVLLVVIAAGEVSLGLLIGYEISRRIQARYGSYGYLAVGVVVLELIRWIPYVGIVFSLVVLPIGALGTCATGMIDGFVKKIFYDSPFEQNGTNCKQGLDSIREVIFTDMKKFDMIDTKK